MTFVPKKNIGREVQLVRDLKTEAGTYTSGHIFKITAEGNRGFDLKDSDGNEVLETSFIRDHYRFVDEMDEEMLMKARVLGISLDSLNPPKV